MCLKKREMKHDEITSSEHCIGFQMTATAAMT